MTKTQWVNIKKFLKIDDHEHRLKGWWMTPTVMFVDFILLYAAFDSAFSKNLLSNFEAIVFFTVVLLHCYLWLHEAAHKNISRRYPWLNTAIGHVSGWMVGLPFLNRQRNHLLHHIWVGHPVGDPTNAGIIELFSSDELTIDKAEKIERVWSSWFPGLVINYRLRLWSSMLKIRKFKNIVRVEKERFHALLHLIGYVCFLSVLLFLGEISVLFTWILPSFLLFFVLEELVNLPHHAETRLLDSNAPAVPYWEQGSYTHSCRSIPNWSKFIILNFNLHTAHHIFPNVPWYMLPIADSELAFQDKHVTDDEITWAITRRRRSLLRDVMAHYKRAR